MRFTLAHRAYLLLSGILLAVIVMGVSFNQISKLSKSANATVAHSRMVIASIKVLQSSVQETGAMITLADLTGDEKDRSACNTKSVQISKQVKELKDQTSDNPRQQAYLTNVELALNKWNDLSRQLLSPGEHKRALEASSLELLRKTRAQQNEVNVAIQKASVEEQQQLLVGPFAVVDTIIWFTYAFWTGIALFLVFIGIGTIKLVRGITSPIQRISEGVGLVGKGEFSHKVSIQGENELGDLTKQFNAMALQLHDREDALKTSEQRLQTIVNSVGSLIYVKDRDGRYELINDQYEIATGLKRKDVLGKTAMDLFPKDIAVNIVTHDRHVVETGIPIRYEEPHAFGQGSYLSTRVPLKNEEGQVIGTCGVSIDITELKATQAVIEEKNRLLAERNKDVEKMSRHKTEFLASMSHELRTPLTAIIGFSELLDEQTRNLLSEKQLRWVGHIRTGANHLLQLINDILDLAKIESGQLSLELEDFAADEIVPEVLSIIKPLAMVKQIEIKPPVPQQLFVYADRIRLKQVLYNLLSNAVKFTEPSGAIRVEISEKDKMVVFSVTDTGVGIKPEDQADVFEEFHQVGETTRGIREGTGLGLAIVKRLVNAQGGNIWLDSEIGKGSCFSFSVPLGKTVERYWSNRAPQARKIHEIAPENGRPLILIVEDEAAAQELFLDALPHDEFSTVIASTPTEAVEKARTLRPALITLDIMMPSGNGWEVLDTLKRDTTTKDIPIVVVSIMDRKELGFILGANEYLVKPVQKNVLLSTIRNYLPATEEQQKVLIVDDDPLILRVIGDEIESAGCTVLHASNGKEAMEVMESDNPNAVVLDLMMPEMDGFEVLHKIRCSDKFKEIPVFVLTGRRLTTTELEKLKGQTSAVLLKDKVWKGELLRHVRAVIDPLEKKGMPA